MLGSGGGKFQKKDNPPDEEWMLTFADMVSLLLAFFIMLASISKVDPVLFEQVRKGVAKDIGRREVLQPLEMLKVQVKETVQQMGLEGAIGVGNDDRGVTIEFPTTNFFTPGQASLTPAAVGALQRIAVTVADPAFHGFEIEVQGHTDDTPINTPQFPSNWELSAARAAAAVRIFIAAGIEPPRLKSVGLAEVAPKVPNRDMNGNPMPTNQSINRRILVSVHPR